MDALDVLIRAAAGTLLLTLAALVARAAPRRLTPWLFLALALCICGFLAGNTPGPGLWPPEALSLPINLLAGNAAVFLWLFALSLFDDDFRLDGWKLLATGGWIALSFLTRGAPPTPLATADLGWLVMGWVAAMVGHLGWRLLRDRSGDLIDNRRRARSVFVAALASLLATDLLVDVLMGTDWRPQGFTVAQNAAILLIAVGGGAWLVRADADRLRFRPTPAAPAPALGGTRASSDALVRRVRDLVEIEYAHRDTELDLPGFVRRAGAPEAEVRRAVRELGYGHFRAFLNAHRVADARAALADPAKAELKLAVVAWDAGFASLASFNRAFKLAEGRAPSEYRAERLAAGTSLSSESSSEPASPAPSGN